MKAKELKELLKSVPDEAQIIICECTTNYVTNPEYVYLGNDGNLWFRTEDENFAMYIHAEKTGRAHNLASVNNLKVEGIKSVFNEAGEEFTLEEIEKYVENPDADESMTGPYYRTDPTV